MRCHYPDHGQRGRNPRGVPPVGRKLVPEQRKRHRNRSRHHRRSLPARTEPARRWEGPQATAKIQPSRFAMNSPRQATSHMTNSFDAERALQNQIAELEIANRTLADFVSVVSDDLACAL